MDAIQLTTDSKAFQKKSTLDGLIEMSLSRMIESRHLDSNLRSRLSSLADSAKFMDTIICRILTRKRFKTSAARFVNKTAHDQVQVATEHARFQEAGRAPNDFEKLEPVEVLSPTERSPSPSDS